MYKNSLLEKLREGKTVAGVIVHGQSPNIIEILALSGCDYVVSNVIYKPSMAMFCHSRSVMSNSLPPHGL